MSSDNAIPVTASRDVTRLYFDGGSAFGIPHAAPSTSVAPGRTWDHAQLLSAAKAGAAGGQVHPDILAALCARYVDLTAELVDEREESVRLARLHAQLSRQMSDVLRLYRALVAENIGLRRRLAEDLDADQTLRIPMQFDDDAVAVDGAA